MSNINRLVEGVGINDADYVVKTQKECHKIDGKRVRKLEWICPYYQKWKNMLLRCYNSGYKENYPTYKDVTCCEEWLTFSNFKSWMEQQDWEGKCLDKDLLVYQNRIYSPDTCVFIDARLNNFMVKCDNRRGNSYLGTSPHRKGFTASCWDNITSSQYLGHFTSELEAHRAWQKAKILIAKNLKDEYKENAKICSGIERVINKLQYDHDNNLVTESF